MALVLLGASGCGPVGLVRAAGSGADAGFDGGVGAGATEAGEDAGSGAGGGDAGTLDAGGLDAGASDAGASDAGASDAGASDAGASDAGQGTEGLGPPYPIVLAHGFFGFDDFAGAGFLDYFYGVRARLRAGGEAQVYTPAVDPFSDSAHRGAQLLAAVESIVEETGAAKVNLIGHSQGGIDARWVAHARPDLVASVTTIATPHHGTPLADIVLGVIEDARAQDLADALLRLLGAPIWDAMGKETSVVAALRQLSTKGMEAFNRAVPNAPEVAYFSIAGRSDRNLAASLCRIPGSPTFLRRWDHERDPIDPLLDLPEQILDGGLFDPYPNDGLVRVVDARWGTFLGCIPADHLDEIGQIAGDRPGLFNDWDYLDFYAELVDWLRAQGY